MAKYEKYAEYQDSGVEWLGEIPNDWNSIRLKHLIIGNLVYGANEAAEDDNPNNPRYIRITDMNNDGSLDPNTFRSLPYHIAENYLLEDGDILLARSGATVGKSFLFKNEFGTSCFAGYLIRARANKKKLNPKFAYWFFQSESYWKYVSGSQIQATIQNVSAEKYGDLYLSVPEIRDQFQIANFLDHETAQIDSLIAKQEKLIELLKEKRQAVISHAVTKGLNPDVTMKDSGVEWLGKVPEHWEILKFDYAINTVSDIDHYMPSSVDVGIPYIMTGDLKDFVSDIDFESCKQVTYSDYQKLSRKIKTTKDDIIFARYATIGTLSYVDIDKEFLVSYSCVTIKSKPNRTTGKYLSYYLKSQAFLQAIQQQINSNTQGNVGVDSLRNVKIILPLLSEQENIIEFLQAELIKMDNLINKAESAIQLMQERRTALISSAVTGKIDIRNWQNPNKNNEAKTEFGA